MSVELDSVADSSEVLSEHDAMLEDRNTLAKDIVAMYKAFRLQAAALPQDDMYAVLIASTEFPYNLGEVSFKSKRGKKAYELAKQLKEAQMKFSMGLAGEALNNVDNSSKSEDNKGEQ